MDFLIVFTHFVSDWILQPRSVGKRKAGSFKWMLKHLIIIWVCTAACFLVLGLPLWFQLSLLYTMLHGIQDKFIWKIYEYVRGPYTKEFLDKNKYAEDYWWYFTIAIDQILHLYLLFWIVLIGG